MEKRTNPKIPGTKITYRQFGNPNPAKDNRAYLGNVPRMTDESYIQAMNDPKSVFMHITDDRVLGVNKLKYKGFPFLLIEPNPVTFYYSIAFDTCDQLQDARLKLDAILNSDTPPQSKNTRLAVVCKNRLC